MLQTRFYIIYIHIFIYPNCLGAHDETVLDTRLLRPSSSWLTASGRSTEATPGLPGAVVGRGIP